MPGHPHILANLLHAQATLTGTGYYARHLIKALGGLPDAPRVTGICSPFNRQAFAIPGAGHYRRVTWGRPWRSVMARRLEEWAWLHHAVRDMRPDVFWGPSNFLPPVKVCRYVATIHDMTFFEHPEALSPLRRRYWHAWTHRTVAVADRILTDTETSKRAILRHSRADPDRVVVVPLGAADEYFVARDEAGRAARLAKLRESIPDLPPNYLSFIGTLTVHKNVPRLVEAVARARASGCGDLHLVLAGKRGDGYDRIAGAIARNGLGPFVHELGYVPDELLPALYENARAHILPSFTEGFGLPIVEAMAAGAPVITTGRGAMAEVAGDAAFLVEPEDTSSIADAIACVWSGSELRASMREKGLARAAGFTWDAAARRTLDVLLG